MVENVVSRHIGEQHREAEKALIASPLSDVVQRRGVIRTAADRGRPVRNRDGEDGVAEGLDADGALRLRTASGVVRRITAGDVFFGGA